MTKQKLIIPVRKYQGETSIVSARLPADMIKVLDNIAESTGRNRNEIISMCLEYAIENLESGSSNVDVIKDRHE